MRTLRISVRRLVEFLLRSGDIDADRDGRGSIEAMQAGGDIHRMLQAAGGPSYQAEVSLAGSFFFPDGGFNPYAARLEIGTEAVRDQPGFFLRVEGRADGIVDDGRGPLVVDEIKGVSRDVAAIREPDALHEAQALCYAYLHLRSTRGAAALASAFGEQVVVRVTYASMTTGEVRQLERTHRAPDIEAWFFALLDKAQRWAVWRVRHDELRNQSLAGLSFPFAPRPGQQQIMDAVATAIREGGRLYAQASTGSGKTLATMYPALKAMGAGEIDRIAFLTSKTMTRRPVLECLDLLRRQRFDANVLVVTARNKLCPLRQRAQGADVRARPLASLCNPLECPLARGHYDAANDALYEAIATARVLDAELLGQVAARHHVCPYELQRDATRWADVIVCDYHFAFAPSASLIGLADEPGESRTVYLVDEAHDLVERMRDMYSAELAMADLKLLERTLRIRKAFASLMGTLHAVMGAFPIGEQDSPVDVLPNARERRVRPRHQVVHPSEAFVEGLAALVDGIDAALEQLLPGAEPAPGGSHAATPGASGTPDGKTIEAFLTLRDTQFKVRALLGALQRAEAGYVSYLGRAEQGGKKLKVLCVDPRRDLDERLAQAHAAVFFSGTLLPLDYHRALLAARDEDSSIYARSSFDPHHLRVLIGADVSARFSQRGAKLYERLAAYLVALTRARPGNYLAFLPSYAMLEEVASALGPHVDARTTVVRQQPRMREPERERFVAQFRTPHEAGRSLLGLCVLGGIFGESIDLPGTALVGVVVVGIGMPGISDEREVIRDYFDAREGNGFAYAYTYPGMGKVLQAVGRLIRTETDRGTALLLDNRFLEDELQRTFPQEWQHVQSCTLDTVPDLLARD